MASHLEGIFPRLRYTTYTIVGDASWEYNCVAHALGLSSKWWWPSRSSDDFWPSGVPRKETVDAFIQAFATFGFAVCDHADFESGLEKLAIYMDRNKPVHVARQLPDGRWTSKLGPYEVIEHELEGLVGDKYGAPEVFMARATD